MSKSVDDWGPEGFLLGMLTGVVIGARVTPQLAAHIRQHAEARHLSVSAFVGALLLAAIGTPAPHRG